MIRIRAIYNCLYFGILPYWMYEKECHYKGMTYWEHLELNLETAFRWITFKETKSDYKFERLTNHNF